MQRRSIEMKSEQIVPKPKRDSGLREIARRILRNPVVGPMLLATAIGLGSVQRSEAQNTIPTEPAPTLETAEAGSNGANLRYGMSTSAEVFQRVPAGTDLVVQDVEDPNGSSYDWLRVISINGEPVAGDVFVAREILVNFEPVVEPAPEAPEEIQVLPTEPAEGYVPTTEIEPTAVLEPSPTATDWSERELTIGELQAGLESHEGLYAQSEAQVVLVGRVRGFHQGGGHMPEDENIWYMELGVDGRTMFFSLGSEEAGAVVSVSELSQIGQGENAIYRVGSDFNAFNIPLSNYLDYFRENTNVPVAFAWSPQSAQNAREDFSNLPEGWEENPRIAEIVHMYENSDTASFYELFEGLDSGSYLEDTSVLDNLVILQGKNYVQISSPEPQE